MVVKWREVFEEGFRLKLPETLRRMRLGPLFKGKMTKGIPDTELTVLVDLNVSHSYLMDCQQGSSRPPPFTERDGLKWTYHIRGTSKTRTGGWEVKISQTAPNPRGRGYSWVITFPVNGRWVNVDITNGGGGLEWNEFDEIAEKIIRSIEAV